MEGIVQCFSFLFLLIATLRRCLSRERRSMLRKESVKAAQLPIFQKHDLCTLVDM